MKIKGWNLFEIIWLVSFSAIELIIAFTAHESFLGITTYLAGVFCVVLAAKGNIWNYPVGIYNSVVYAFISYQNGLFGEVMLNLLFFVPTGIIGWIMWSKKMQDSTVIMRKMKLKFMCGMILLGALGTLAYGFWLSTLKGQNTPYMDSFNVVASIIATILMMLRFREQWVFYIGINIAETVMWVIRFAHGGSDTATMVVMWVAYLVNSVYGLYVWNKGSQAKADDGESSIEASLT